MMAMIKDWRTDRFRSTVICILYNFLFGFEFTSVIISLVYYLGDYFESSQKYLMYGVIVAVTYVPALFSGIVGKIGDRTKNIRFMMAFILFVIGTGNILYTIHFSIWFLVIGRFLAGFGVCLRSSIAGELGRWYKDERSQLANVLFMYNIFFASGFVIGPASASLFTRVDFFIGALHITKDNLIGLVMGFLSFSLMFAAIFGVKNHSKEVTDTSKQHLQPEKNVDKLLTFKEVIYDKDIMLVIISNAWLSFAADYNNLIIVMVAKQDLKMNMTRLAILTFISFALFFVFMFLIWKRYFTKQNALNGVVLCLFCACYTYMAVVVSNYLVIEYQVLKDAIVLSTTVLNAVSGISVIGASREVLFAIVPSHSTGFVDGIRSSCTMLLSGLGCFVASSLFQTIRYSELMTTLVMVLLATFLCHRSKSIYKRMELMNNLS